MAQNELAPLVTTMEARISRFEKQLAKATGTVDRQAGRQEKRWRKQHSRVDRRFKAMGKSMATGLTVGATLAVAGLTALTKQALQAADDIQHFSEQTGVSAETLQEYSFIASRLGLSQADMNKAFEMGTKGLGEYVTKGTGPAADAIKTLGLEQEIASGKISNAGDLLDRMNEILEGNNSALDKAGIAGQLFGTRYGVKLVEALSQGEKGLADMKAEARDLGVVMNNEAVASASKANDALEKLGDTVRGNVRGALIEAAPEIEQLANQLLALGPVLADWASSIVSGLVKTGEAIGWLSDQWNASPFGAGAKAADPKSVEGLVTRRLELNRLARAFDEVEKANGGFMDAITRSSDEKVLRALEVKVFGKEQIAQMRKDGVDIRAAISDEYKRIYDLEAEARETASAIDAPVVDFEKASFSTSKASKDEKDISAAAIDAEIEAIRELGRTESEQIQELLAERLTSIEKSKLAESEKIDLRAKANADAQKELKEIADAEAEFNAQAMADIEAQKEADFRANQDRLGFAAEIAAATARMSGRALEATQIELDATRARYEAELAYIDEVIAKKGASAELLAQRDNAQAGIASADEAQDNLRRSAKDSIRGFSDGGDDGLEGRLAKLQEEQDAKLVQLEQFRSDDLELMRLYEEEKLQIEAEFSEKRKQLRLADIEAQLSAASTLAENIGRIGKEGSKAQKAAAKVQKGIALGQAAINTYQAVSAAVASAPFPFNVPAIAFATATGAAQIAGIASQNFAKGGVGITGRGTTTSDSIPANLSRGESVITAKATRGNESGLRGLNRGLTPAEAFGFDVPQPNYKASQFSTLSQSSVSVGGTSITITGNADNEAISRLESMLANDRKNRAREFNIMANKRDKRLTSRTERRVGA